MPHTSRTVRVAGTWLASASLLMVAVFVFHGPVAPDPGEQMRRIAADPVRWGVVHWVAAGALSLYAIGGLIALTSASRLIEGPWTSTAWAAVPVTALWTVTTAVVEATVIADAAAAGASDTFAAWWAYGEGAGNGYAVFALAVAVIAASEAQTADRAVPAWSAWVAAAAGLGSFAGWGLGSWFGVAAGGPLWVGSSILMSLWLVWFGAALARSRT